MCDICGNPGHVPGGAAKANKKPDVNNKPNVNNNLTSEMRQRLNKSDIKQDAFDRLKSQCGCGCPGSSCRGGFGIG